MNKMRNVFKKKILIGIYPNIMTGFGLNGTKFHAQHENTNYIFYNRGIWGAIQPLKAKQIMSSIYQMIGGGGDDDDDDDENGRNRCFFKSTTGYYGEDWKHLKHLEDGLVRNITYNAGCEYFDVGHVTEKFSTWKETKHHGKEKNHKFYNTYWDRVHYVPWVYEELNNLLLNVLCNTKRLS